MGSGFEISVCYYVILLATRGQGYLVRRSCDASAALWLDWNGRDRDGSTRVFWQLDVVVYLDFELASI